jgi:hypothetical protein
LLVTSAEAQGPTITAQEIVQSFLTAIGQEKTADVKSLAIKAEVTGDISQAIGFYKAPKLAKEHGTWESYYKAPNLRLTFVRTEKNAAASMAGCDGTQSWYFTPWVGLHEVKPKAGDSSSCDAGIKLVPSVLLDPKTAFALKGTTQINHRACYEVQVKSLKGTNAARYFFDIDTFLLIRTVSFSEPFMGLPSIERETDYSDYRQIAGFKYPFSVKYQSNNTSAVIVVSDIAVNGPIDDSLFSKPKAP